MFTISPTLMQQCIDMVAKGQDYIPFPDGLEADYSVFNIHGEGVWIVEPWATEGGDYIKVMEIVLPEQKAVKAFHVVYPPVSGGLLQLCGEDYCLLEEAEATYAAYGNTSPRECVHMSTEGQCTKSSATISKERQHAYIPAK